MKNLNVIHWTFAIFMMMSFVSLGQNSVLSEGYWFKLAIDQSGIYKINYNDLLSYGISPAQINPKKIQIYGNGNGMLPEANNAFRYHDLKENAIFVFGENDEVFDQGDYILFYGEGPTDWKLNEATGYFDHQVNYYSDYTYYFITIGTEVGKRIINQAEPPGNPTQTIQMFNDYFEHEEENHNLIRSGKTWYGEIFSETTSYTFNPNIVNLLTDFPVHLKSSFANRSFVNCSMEISADGEAVSTVVLTSIFPSSTKYAQKKTDTISFFVNNPAFELNFTYNQPNDSAIAWLDYFELNFINALSINGNQLKFRSLASLGAGEVSLFEITNADVSTQVWNVTDPINISEIDGLLLGDQLDFKVATDSLLEFIAFSGTEFESPEFIGEVENQNLHGLNPVDYIIITTEDFLEPAQQIADFHQTQDGLMSEVVMINQIYNEFSSGAQDITAIRDFIRYMYDQSSGESPNYVLLFGDASYDFKDRIENNTNFVPTFQTTESLNTSASASWDDYFSWLDEEEGTTGTADIAVSRIPVKTFDEAQSAVNKIIHYSLNSEFGDWKNRIMFMADDADGNLHQEQADSLALVLSAGFGVININKNYLDFYELVQTPEGPRYPVANEKLNNAIDDGLLILNYTGHGGVLSWAHERVLTLEDIQDWQNISRLPFLITSTCQFSLFDDPAVVSGGEAALLKEDGGCIAIFGQSRLAYSQSNFVVNKYIFEYIGSDDFKTNKRFGDIFKYVKQNTGNQIATYANSFLGDPALKINFPDNKVVTNAINGINLPVALDTIHPGDQITVEGILEDGLGNPLNNFNGNLMVTVFERPYLRQTLGNSNTSYITDIEVQDSIMIELQAEVVNGQFEYAFTVPSNPSQEYGTIKLSHYAFNQVEDASGYFSEIMVGGDPNAINSHFANKNFSVFPTIADSKLTVLNNGKSEILQTRIIELSGKILMSQDFTGITKTNRIELNVSSLPSGFYILRVVSGDGIGDVKFIKR